MATTKSEDSVIAAEAMIGLRKPSAASGIAAALYPKAQARLRRMVRKAARASPIASGTVSRSSRSRIMSAAEMATSVPDPRASPRSAAASAGPSLTPSPTMATRYPSARSPVMTAALSAGSVPAMTWSMPTAAATARAVGSLSPVSRTGRSPSARSSAMAGAADGLTVSATAMAPRAAPSQPASTAVRPACSHSRHCRGEVGGHGQAVVGEQPLAPDEDLAAVDGAACAEPGQRPEPVGLRQRRRFRQRGLGDRRGHRVLGRLLDRSRAAQQLGAAHAVGGAHAGQRHLAGGDGPGLVQDDHVDRARGFEGLVALDEYPVGGAAAGRRDERGGRRQAERARAGDDQHGEPRAERGGSG